jgi:predicted transcriptional regulator of viral defense system
MDFERLLALVGDEPLFETSLLLAGEVNPDYLRLQLTRWKNAGRIIQLRRGLYTLAPPYRKVRPHPFLIANRLRGASYVSLQSALAFHGLIPENVPQTLSVTGGRPGRWETPLGVYRYHHLKPDLLFGYRMTALGGGQQALVAVPEKALLDLIYLQAGGDDPAYLETLRLQNLDLLRPDELNRLAERFASSKVSRAVATVLALMQTEKEYETL